MKKLILISALLLLGSNSWADDKMPIDLTCYVSNGIIQFHIENNVEESWWLIPEINGHGHSYSLFGQKKNFIQNAGKPQRTIKELEITDTNIFMVTGRFEKGLRGYDLHSFSINRYTGRINSAPSSSGFCNIGHELPTEKKF